MFAQQVLQVSCGPRWHESVLEYGKALPGQLYWQFERLQEKSRKNWPLMGKTPAYHCRGRATATTTHQEPTCSLPGWQNTPAPKAASANNPEPSCWLKPWKTARYCPPRWLTGALKTGQAAAPLTVRATVTQAH